MKLSASFYSIRTPPDGCVDLVKSIEGIQQAVENVEPFCALDPMASSSTATVCRIEDPGSGELYRPVKLNYEIHGNTLPHLHMHLFPRQPDDGFIGRPIDVKDTRHCYSDDDLANLRSALARITPSV